MPSRIHAKNTDIYVDEFDFGGVTNRAEISIDNPTPEVTAFNDGDATYVEGKPTFTFNIQGLHSTATPNYDGEMFTDLTSEARRVGIYPNQAAVGERGYEGDCNISDEPIITRLQEAIALNVTWQGDTPVLRAQVLYKNAAVAASENGTAYQTGSVSATQKVVGILRLLSAPGGAGTNTCDVVVASDDAQGFVSGVTRLTFTQLNQASVALHEVQSANGAITDTWWRVQVTIAGTGSRTFDLLVVIGITAQP